MIRATVLLLTLAADGGVSMTRTQLAPDARWSSACFEPSALLGGVGHGEASTGSEALERVGERDAEPNENRGSNQRRSPDAHAAVNDDPTARSCQRLEAVDQRTEGRLVARDAAVRKRKADELEPSSGGEAGLFDELKLGDLSSSQSPPRGRAAMPSRTS